MFTITWLVFFCILILLPTLSLLSKGGQGEHTDFWPSPPFDPPCPRIWPMCTWDKRFTLLTQIFTFQAAECLQVPCLRSSAGKDDLPAAKFRPNDLLLLTRQQPEDLGQGAPPKYLQMLITHLSDLAWISLLRIQGSRSSFLTLIVLITLRLEVLHFPGLLSTT